MDTAQAIRYQGSQPWFASWFDSADYHRLYSNRDQAEADRFVDGLLARLQPPRSARVLDLGCGAGRYARRVAAHGFDVTGLDLIARKRLHAVACGRAAEGRQATASMAPGALREVLANPAEGFRREAEV